MTNAQFLRRIRFYVAIILVGLFLSGVTAFPLQTETTWLIQLAASLDLDVHAPTLFAWFIRVHDALADTNTRYPFLAYGTDWLAFAHLVIATAFFGLWQDPVRNKWLVIWGMISCVGVFFLALIAGPIRGIPFYWRLIDCSFGLFCAAALIPLRALIRRLEAQTP